MQTDLSQKMPIILLAVTCALLGQPLVSQSPLAKIDA